MKTVQTCTGLILCTFQASIHLYLFLTGAGPGFLERGFICIRCGIHFAEFISLFLNIPWKWNNLVWLRPNYFIFIRYLKRGGGGGAVRGFKRTPWTPSGSATVLYGIVEPFILPFVNFTPWRVGTHSSQRVKNWYQYVVDSIPTFLMCERNTH